MNRYRIIIPKNAGKVVVVVLALLAVAAMQAQSAALAAPRIPQTGAWEQQAPYPTRYHINGVDMVTDTEAWAVASTDIVHTTDGGATWEHQSRPGADVLDAIQFFDNQHGIATGNTTLYTYDGGATWYQAPGVTGYGVEMADANLAFITDHRVAGYMRSTNGGATWTFRAMPSNITTIQCFDALNCVAASPSGVYHSADGGLNWTFVAGPGGAYESTYFVSHNLGWFVYGDTARHTTDGGATWQAQTLPPASWIYHVVFSNANDGWAVGDNMVRTTDGGATWQEVSLRPESLPLWAVDFVDAQHGIAGGDAFLATDSVLITSTDGGASWTTRTQGSINQVLNMVALDRDHAWASYDYGGKTARTTNGGATWQVTEVGEQYLALSGIDMADALNGWTVGYETTFNQARIYHTMDGGVSWQQQYDTGALLAGVAALDAQTAIIVGGDSASGPIRHRTTDGGLSWQPMTVPITSFFYDVFFLDNQTGWMVGGDGDIVKTTNGGATWVVQPNPAQYTLVSIHFSDANNGWAGGYYGTLVHTTNGGATWTLQDPQIPEYTHVLDVNSTSPLHGWIAGYGGGAASRPFVKYTTDGGATWIEDTPLVGPYDSFAALAFVDDEYGWAGGAGGIFRHMGAGPPPTATVTAVPPTSTPGPEGTPATHTPVVPTNTPVAPTRTLVAPTRTATPTATRPAASATRTPVASATPGGPTATPCAVAFSDVHPADYFYTPVLYLACHGVVSGYADSTFRPYNETTRGQMVKIVVLGFGLPILTPAGPSNTFADVPLTFPFYQVIETAAAHGIVSGYTCGGPGEPCDARRRPYFRPYANVTRGQLSKIAVSAAGWPLQTPAIPTFRDVAPASAFYSFVETAVCHGVVSGYADGAFRPSASATRGQISKIVYLAITAGGSCGPWTVGILSGVLLGRGRGATASRDLRLATNEYAKFPCPVRPARM